MLFQLVEDPLQATRLKWIIDGYTDSNGNKFEGLICELCTDFFCFSMGLSAGNSGTLGQPAIPCTSFVWECGRHMVDCVIKKKTHCYMPSVYLCLGVVCEEYNVYTLFLRFLILCVCVCVNFLKSSNHIYYIYIWIVESVVCPPLVVRYGAIEMTAAIIIINLKPIQAKLGMGSVGPWCK